MTTPRVSPIYVIAGFLGSGKTTLLKRALAHELDRGVKPAVLMNEFGEVDVDGAILHEHPRSNDIELQSLLNGCICCDLSGEFSDKVGQLVKRSKGAPLFIETTGLADTGQVVSGVERALAADQQTGKQARLASVIVMVDAPRFMKLGTYWSAAEAHLQRADTVILNKLDQVNATRADLIEQRIKSVNPKARLIRAVHADVEMRQVLTSAPATRSPAIANGTITDSTAGYQSGSFRITKAFDPELLEGWLNRFQRSVVRFKGFVKVAGLNGLQEVQWVMGSLSIVPYVGSKQSQAKVVVIGRRVPWQRFFEGLERCLVRPKRQTKRWSRATRRKP